MMKVPRSREIEDAEVIIIPMIDTMMFLLMVFIVASLTLAVQEGIPVNLPKASTAEKHQAQNITITLTAQQRIYVNTVPATIDQIQGDLVRLNAGDGTLVIINSDRTVPEGLVVDAMNGSRKAGITHFAIATETD
jgi:biopolymer transport protein ExbD